MDSFFFHNYLHHSTEMVLIDDLLVPDISSQGDLYEILVAEPIWFKKTSTPYDYQPALVAKLVETTTEVSLEKCLSTTSLSQQQAEVVVRKCTCAKTKCQKNYCECFKQGLTCGKDCECLDCCNKQRLFVRKSQDNSSQRCKCQKSHCLKNYCECHLNGRKCGPQCKCVQCSNGGGEEENEEGQSEEKLGLPRKRVKKSTEVTELQYSLDIFQRRNASS